MYRNVVALSSKDHAGKRLRPHQGYEFARGETVMPVSAAELPQLVARLPIGFLDSGRNGLRPMALLGIDTRTNLLVAPDGRWLQDYVPAAIRRYPFILMRRSGDGDMGVAVDMDSELLADTDGERLFTDDGEASEHFSRIVDLLRQFEGGMRATARACRRLSEAGLLADWSPTVEVAGKHWRLNGMQRVDEQALNGLDNDAFVALRDDNAVALAYAQLLSMAQLPRLVRLAQARARQQGPDGKRRNRSRSDEEIRFNFDA
ncbi:SapC family protein [Aquisalimonas sp.]|uniref:SapC family protein n=1 Tax=Aquisalimonas sp. TaxID=1872621 RepID=UPI0025C331D9|nr:SapC family protein [Aquisalimonas sp.]